MVRLTIIQGLFSGDEAIITKEMVVVTTNHSLEKQVHQHQSYDDLTVDIKTPMSSILCSDQRSGCEIYTRSEVSVAAQKLWASGRIGGRKESSNYPVQSAPDIWRLYSCLICQQKPFLAFPHQCPCRLWQWMIFDNSHHYVACDPHRPDLWVSDGVLIWTHW